MSACSEKKCSTAQVYNPIYQVQESILLYNDKVLLALPHPTEFVQTKSKWVYEMALLLFWGALFTGMQLVCNPLQMPFCELSGECIWSCSPGGQCAEKKLASDWCAWSTSWKTRKIVHGTRMPPPIVFISPAINNVKHIFRPWQKHL